MIRYIQYRYYTLLQYIILLKHIIKYPRESKLMINWFKQFRSDITNCKTYEESINILDKYK